MEMEEAEEAEEAEKAEAEEAPPLENSELARDDMESDLILTILAGNPSISLIIGLCRFCVWKK